MEEFIKILFLLCFCYTTVLGYNISLVPQSVFIVETETENQLISTIGKIDTGVPATGTLSCRISKTEVTLLNGVVSESFGSPFTIGSLNTNQNTGGILNLLGNNIVYNAASPFRLLTASSSISRYELFVTCVDDNNREQDNAPSVLINVVSNTKPSFRQPFVTKSINVGLNASVTPGFIQFNTTANVINDQTSDVLSFSIRNTDPNVDYFTLNPATGIIRNKVDLRTATISPIELTIDVSDGFNSADTPLTLTMELTNMNNRPDIVGLPDTIDVDEDTQTLNLIDLTVTDEGNIINKEPECVVTPTGGKEVFDLVTRPISLKPRGNQFGRTFLDFETTPKYTITCTVSDGFLSSQNEVLIVNVNNINEPPVFSETLYYCTMDESPAGESACNLGFNIKDPEGNQFITRLFQDENSRRFALTSTSTNINNNFNFLGQNDRLTFNTNYDVDQGNMPERPTLFVNAIDEFGATGTATISVVVRDVNDNTPEFDIVNSAVEIDYSTRTGLLGSISATDDDAGSNGEIDYKLVGVVPPNAINFVSVLGNGDIQYIRQYPDSLAGSSVYLSVEAKDRGSPARSSTGTVVVTLIATTTTTTTTTPTTTTPTTTIASTTTTEAGFFDKSENIAIFAVLMTLLLLLLLLALYFCFRWCITGSCTGSGAGGGGMCDCCQPAQNTTRRVTPIVYDEFPPVTSGDYKGDFWRSGDYYESGRPF